MIIAVAAIVAGVVLAALRLYKFTLIRDGDILRTVRGLLSKQSGSIPVERIQAVRIVEGAVQAPLGLCSLQVEVAGIGRTNTNKRTVFPLLRTANAAALVRRALPELAWPSGPLHPVPRAIHRRYLTVPLWWGLGFTVVLLFLPDWWTLLAVLPVPVAIVVGVLSGREAAWRLDRGRCPCGGGGCWPATPSWPAGSPCRAWNGAAHPGRRGPASPDSRCGSPPAGPRAFGTCQPASPTSCCERSDDAESPTRCRSGQIRSRRRDQAALDDPVRGGSGRSAPGRRSRSIHATLAPTRAASRGRRR